MSALVIPAIFEAIDRVTAPLRKMEAAASRFSTLANNSISTNERWFKKLTPVLSDTTREMMNFAKSAAIASGIVGGIYFSFNQLSQFESNLASFRTIVSDLSDSEFGKFREQIFLVAKDTKKSSVEIADSFSRIAGLNADFAKTADGLGAISKAAITLSKASGDDLTTSTESLVGIMNQFKFAATDADRVINVLAAGQAVGAASITQTAASFKNFGSVASGANISIEESIGLIQTLGKYSLFGEEAGTKLRGSILKLQNSGLGYKNGQFNINSALEETLKKYNSLGSAKKKDAYLNQVFGAENITAGRILLTNIDIFKDYTKSVTGTSEAEKAAAINSNTLTNRITELKNTFINLLTSTDESSFGLTLLKNSIVFITDNMGTLITVAMGIVGFFALWKFWIITTKLSLLGMKAVSSIFFLVDMVKYIASTRGLTFAQAAWAIATEGATGAMTALNLAMKANPIGFIIIGVTLLIALIATIVKKWDDWGAALVIFLGPLGGIISLIQSFRKNWNLVLQSFKNGGIISGIKAIGAVILDAIIYPIQQLLEVIGRITGLQWASDAANSINNFREKIGTGDRAMAKTNMESNWQNSNTPFPMRSYPSINPDDARNQLMMQKFDAKNLIEIQVKDESGKSSVSKNTGGIPIKTTTTMAQY